MTQVQDFFTKLSHMSIRSLLLAALTVVLGYIAIKLVTKVLKKALNKTSLDGSITHLLITLTKLILYYMLLTICMSQLGISPTSLITLLGVFGLAISLSLQDSLSNMAGGILVLTAKPFSLGDYVEVGAVQGTVARIGLNHTILNTVDNKRIYIPNGALSKATIINYSAEGRRQAELTFSIGYQDDSVAARALILQIVAADERTERGTEPFVKVWALKESSVDILVRVWCDAADMISLRCDLYEKVKIALTENGFHIPYPQLDVHCHDLKTL
ncbi:mechanosensitive ion channel family protein [Acidaminobacterium chupaoyuni]